MKDKDLLHTVELNGAHIEIYKNSVIFYDEEKEDCWEYEWKKLFRLTEEECRFPIKKELTPDKPELPEEIPYHCRGDGDPLYYNLFEVAETLNILIRYLKAKQ